MLAYILGPMIERAARQVLAISPGLLLERPVFWMFIMIAVAATWFSHHLAVRGGGGSA